MLHSPSCGIWEGPPTSNYIATPQLWLEWIRCSPITVLLIIILRGWGSFCEVFSDPANHCQELLNRNTFQHFRSSWKRLIHFSFVVFLGFSLLMTAAKIYKWNGSAKRRIWGLKSSFPHENFTFILWLSWDRNYKRRKQRVFSFNTVGPPESSWFLRTASLTILWLKTQKLKHFWKGDLDLLRLKVNVWILKNRSYLDSIIYGN